MNENKRISGNTTVSPDVIETIIRETTSEIKGINRIFTNSSNDGIKIKISNDLVYADIYIVLNQREKVLEVSRDLQKKVSRAIYEMIGMEIGSLNVHVEDYEYPEEAK